MVPNASEVGLVTVVKVVHVAIISKILVLLLTDPFPSSSLSAFV